MQNKKTIHERGSIYKKINIKYLTASNLLVNKNTQFRFILLFILCLLAISRYLFIIILLKTVTCFVV